MEMVLEFQSSLNLHSGNTACLLDIGGFSIGKYAEDVRGRACSPNKENSS